MMIPKGIREERAAIDSETKKRYDEMRTEDPQTVDEIRDFNAGNIYAVNIDALNITAAHRVGGHTRRLVSLHARKRRTRGSRAG